MSQKNAPIRQTKNGQTWQACKHSKVVQRGLTGSEMENQDVFDDFRPFWAHLDTFGPFQTKINFLPHKDKVEFGGGAFDKKIIFI